MILKSSDLKSRRAPQVPLRARQHRLLHPIQPPSNGSRTVLELSTPGSVFLVGDGPPISYDCGKCHSPLLVDVTADDVENVVFHCPNCGTYNESPRN